MDDPKEHPSEEDIPSDFFDDFNKDEFIQGLSVIDSWDDEDQSARKDGVGSRPRIDAKAVDGVKDLRELIDGKEMPSEDKHEDNAYSRRRSDSASRLDAYIQPGSRRDPSKTSEAIRKDKEIKVKEYLAKHLESSDDIRPPGTELDDFFENRKSLEKRRNAEKIEENPVKESPVWEFPSPQRSPRRMQLERSPRRIPQYNRSPRRSPHRRSPYRRSPHRRSPFRRFSPRRRQWRYSPPRRMKKPRFSPHRPFRDRSPGRHYGPRRSRSRSMGRRDDFLYPKESSRPNFQPNVVNSYHGSQNQPYAAPGAVEYSVDTEYSYPPGQTYPGYTMSYDYGGQPGTSGMVPVPQPVPAPNVAPSLNLNTGPQMVPPPLQMNTPAASQQVESAKSRLTPFDPLAQLVADGTLSHEDYLKLAPNKGVANPPDMQAKLLVIKRCNQAITELDKLALPTRLLVNHSTIGIEQKSLAPKFCSPLKRQVTVEFNFTKASTSATAHQNKQIVDNIIAAVGLDKLIDRPKKKVQKNTKDAAVQTTKHACEVCEIRNATKCFGVGTSTEPEYFTTSVHTQVVEQDLISSKAVFNPTGSASNNPTMSIAHLTPAQLVSQLAARAKTLKQSPDPGQQYGRLNSPGYDGRGPPGRHYQDFFSNYHRYD